MDEAQSVAETPQDGGDDRLDASEQAGSSASGNYMAVIGVGVGSALPRDQFVVTPHFHDGNATKSPSALATKLGDSMQTWLTGSYKITVTVYDAFGTKPNPPLATYIKNSAGGFINANAPQEIALCLSYYSGFNRPRLRGRLYLPYAWIFQSSGTGTASVRPTSTQQLAVRAFADTVLKSGISIGCDWTVCSKAAAQNIAVTNYYVDDEWDTQRRRGGKPTGRIASTYP